ncbi:right-handed parallel beta-helix repeat-containing protein [Pedobacter foliorum]|uniref:alpha-1,3-galactosidase-related protein n=1 Tax=Pedobacter foliorum TaxID=2739058 RepID=UPI0015647B4D|nr:right-handed parallel beta-helix repeat-containing protein [Pedobacter foliorum]NRF39556.1 right-handed parallel beta-helix repeat-containing protein [Pedobacter foliorum]
MKKYFAVLLLFSCFQVRAQVIDVTKFGVNPNTFADATEGVKKAINATKEQPESVLNFPKGRYDFWPDNATETYYYISNSSSEKEFPVKKQRVGLFLKGLKNITIEGNGSVFVFHGKMVTWVLDSCENITIQNLAINYERPGMSEMTIKELTPTSVIASIHPDSKFAIINNRLEWYGEKWMTRNYHAVLVRPTEGSLFYSKWDPFLASKAEKIDPLTVKFTGDFSKFKAQPNDVLTIRDPYRDYVCAFNNRSKNIKLHNLKMYSLHGLGIVSQFSENLNFDSVFVEPEKGSGRVIASSADGMHFSGCKGQITINNCRFNGLHDDPVNVHGTHLIVSEIVSATSLKLKFMHHQTYGFEAFISGDTVAYLHASSLQIFAQGVVKTAKLISEREMLVEMQKPFTAELKVGDALENITWTPSVVIKNSLFAGTISRGNLITTRRKVVIENNIYYRTGMHAILIENDASGWYESGPVTDVTIRSNQFIECGHNSSPNNYVISINPQNHQLVPNYYVHKNIRIADNVFKVYDYPILSARSTDGLTFINNKIIQTNFLKVGEKRPAILLTGNTKVNINGNDFGSEELPVVSLLNMQKTDIRSDMKFDLKH